MRHRPLYVYCHNRLHPKISLKDLTLPFAKLNQPTPVSYETPSELYSALRRSSTGSKSLWAHQADALKEYSSVSAESDVAIELPTGTGKTLVGLLISYWNMTKGRPALYLVPTKQLADQVSFSAEKEGIPTAVLVGRHDEWDPTAQAEVLASRAIGVTTYSSLFNLSPKLPDAGSLVFDDAHAAEDIIGEAYSLCIRRDKDEKGYQRMLSNIKNHLNPSTIRQLLRPRLEGLGSPVRLFLPCGNDAALEALSKSLTQLDDSYRFKVALINQILDSCAIYISHSQLLIRPYIPPTHLNSKFNNAAQRVYLSATLGSGGELERAFGRESVRRITPKTTVNQGRRFYLFPDLVSGADPIDITKELLRENPKSLILKQSSSDDAEALAEELSDGSIEVFNKSSLASNDALEKFRKSRSGLLALANRFDGLDFPDDSCRMTVLEGKLDALNLQERFLAERVGAHHVLAERISTRIAQATGRCSRDQNDHSAVIILGNETMLQFSELAFLCSQPALNQAEILMGWETSKQFSPADMVTNLRSFLDQNDDWADAENEIITISHQRTQKVPDALHQLASSASLEVRAWQLAHSEEWASAASTLHEAASKLSLDSLRGYRGFLLYQAAVWLEASESDRRSHHLIKDAKESASAAAGATKTWMRETESFRTHSAIEYLPEDTDAITFIADSLSKNKIGKHSKLVAQANNDLQQKDAPIFERGLKELGESLGAKSYKPEGSAHCDSAWLWGNNLWITLEAKSEQKPEPDMSVNDIRQANTQLQALASNPSISYPPGSFSVLITDRTSIGEEARTHALPHVYHVTTADIRAIAADATDAWSELAVWAQGRNKGDFFQKVGEVFAGHNCLPSQLSDRLRANRIGNTEIREA